MTEPRPGTGPQNEATAPTPQAVFHHHHPQPALPPSTTNLDAALSRGAVHSVDGTLHHAGSDAGQVESASLQQSTQSSVQPPGSTRQPHYASTHPSPHQPLLPATATSSSAPHYAPSRPLSGSVMQRCRSAVQSAFGGASNAATACPACSAGSKPLAPLIATMVETPFESLADERFPALGEALGRSLGETPAFEVSPRGMPSSACSLNAEPPPSHASSAGALRDSSSSSHLPVLDRGSLPPPPVPSHRTSADAAAAATAAATREVLVRNAASCVSTTQARYEVAEAALDEARREVADAREYEREILDSRPPGGAGAVEVVPRASEGSPAPAARAGGGSGPSPANVAQAEGDARAAVSMALRVLVANAPGPVRATADRVAGATLNMTSFDVFAASTAVSYIVREWDKYISEGSPFHGFEETATLAVVAYEDGHFASFQLAWKAAVARALAERSGITGAQGPTPVALLSSSYPSLSAESPSVAVPAAVEREMAARMEAECAAALELHAERARNLDLAARLSALQRAPQTPHHHHPGPTPPPPPFGPPPPASHDARGPPPPPPPTTPPGRFGPAGSQSPATGQLVAAGSIVPHSPATSESIAMMPMPSPPDWYDVGLSQGLALPNGVERAPSFALIWAQGPQCREDLRRSPFTAETLCRRIANLLKGQYAWYGNFRGVWQGDVLTQWVWYIKGSRSVDASDSLVASMLSASLQTHAAFAADSHRLIKIEISSVLSPSEKIRNLFWETDKVFVPRKRAAMLLVLQSFRWEDAQSAETLWHVMDAARVMHGESPQKLCEHYLSAIAAVASSEDKNGNGAGNPSERWLLAVNILSIVEDLLSRASPDDSLLEQVRLALDKDRKDAKTPLPPVPTSRGRKEARTFSASADSEVEDIDTDTMLKLRSLEIAQQRQSDIFAAYMQSGRGGGAGKEYRHWGVPGCADVKYIMSTGKVFPAGFFAWEFNPGRPDGKVDHKTCPGCALHSPPITVTYEYKEAVEMNGGYPPTRRSEGNPGPRTLQQHEAMWHLIGKCFDVWDGIWRFVHEHPDDPDATRFKTPLLERDLQERLKTHRRSRSA